ncbi:MAG: hypothetical protein JNJ70_03520 [Verrucomicrobiales bacterium]|nr:hypothetical protein [Verrucomicrobiales bacterium]
MSRRPASGKKAIVMTLPLLASLALVVAPSEERGLAAMWEGETLQITGEALVARGPADRYAWVTLPAPGGVWDLSGYATVEAEVTNTSKQAVDLLLWVVGDRGWDAVPAPATLAPGETRLLSCDLRETWPDKTPKIDPHQVKQVQMMILRRGNKPVALSVRHLRAAGEAPAWTMPAGRLEVPPVEDAAPAPGKRVRFRLPGEEGKAVYSILHLPEDWKAGGTYPVIAEYPGNIFFIPGCYSTGLPDQCVIGYGMTKGRGSICVGLPFIDPATGTIAEHGWGDPDATADHAVRMMEEVCAKFGGDRANLVLTGFSRGALACGYIGLRNDRIAALWKGFHACQHYDGDGWNGATMEGALERAKRFRGRAVFQTDNSPAAFQAVMDAMKTEVTWANSRLGAHATAMFLDERDSTKQLREWYLRLLSTP